MRNKLYLKQFILIFVAVSASLASQAATHNDSEVTRWEQEARNVTIIRDDWGIAHVYGKTDADTVFGTIYAQAEDDFNRV
jgi:acyl-homoserine lactone acylase PvdQ